MWAIWIATSSAASACLAGSTMILASALVAGREPALHEQRVARHPETEGPEDQRRHEIAGGGGLRGGPFRIGEAGVDNAEDIENADDRDERRILEQADEAVDDPWDDDLERLRQYDQAHHLPITEAERACRFVLALGD